MKRREPEHNEAVTTAINMLLDNQTLQCHPMYKFDGRYLTGLDLAKKVDEEKPEGVQ